MPATIHNSTDKPWVAVGERVDHYILNDYQKDPEGNIIHNNGLPLYAPYPSLFGYADPDWLWGINSSLRFKDFTFAISLDGRVGGIAQTTTEMYMWRAGSHPNSVVPERFLDANDPGSRNYTGEGVKVVSGEATYDTYGNITSDNRTYAPNDVAVTYQTYINHLLQGAGDLTHLQPAVKSEQPVQSQECFHIGGGTECPVVGEAIQVFGPGWWV